MPLVAARLALTRGCDWCYGTQLTMQWDYSTVDVIPVLMVSVLNVVHSKGKGYTVSGLSDLDAVVW